MTCNDRHFILSGQNELQELVNQISLEFNDKTRIQLTPGFQELILRETQQTPIRISRNNYLADNGFTERIEIMALLDFPHIVASSAYGCLHDFYDPSGARLAFDSNSVFFYGKYPKAQLSIKTISLFSLFEDSITSTNTHKLVTVWNDTQNEIEKYINEAFPTYSFPVLNTTFTRENDDEGTHAPDKKDVFSFLEKYSIDRRRIVWVVDTFQSWMIDIAANKLNMNGSIVDIDGASSSVSGNFAIRDIIGEFNDIQVGPYQLNMYGNTRPDLPLTVSKGIDQLTHSDTNASVQKIINTITEEFPNRDLSKANRSNSSNVYVIEFLKNLSPDEKVQILQYIKAGGDQAPIDIAEKIVKTIDTPTSDYRSAIFWFTTGDHLAFELAKSRGLPAFLVTSKTIKLSIPTSMTNPDVRIPTIINFFSKIEKMKQYIAMFSNKANISSLLEHIFKIFSYSVAGKIFAAKVMKEFKLYFERCNKHILTIFEAIRLLSEQNYGDFYKYIERSLNNVDFSIDGLYESLFTGEEFFYTFLIEDKKETNKIDTVQEDISSEPTTKIPVSTFCDNFVTYGADALTDSTLDCANEEDAILLKENAPDYLKSVCATDANPNKCMGDRFNLLRIPRTKQLKASPLPSEETVLENTLDESWLLVGDTRSYSRGSWNFKKKDETNKITLDILRFLVKNRSLVEILDDIPSDIFQSDAFANPTAAYHTIQRVSYIFKVIQLALNELDITDKEILVNNIERIFIDFVLCPNVELGETVGTEFQINTSPRNISSGRRKTTPLTKEVIMYFLTNLYSKFSVPEIMVLLIDTVDISGFSSFTSGDSSGHLQTLIGEIEALKTSNFETIIQYPLKLPNSYKKDYDYVIGYSTILFDSYSTGLASFSAAQSRFYEGGRKRRNNRQTKRIYRKTNKFSKKSIKKNKKTNVNKRPEKRNKTYKKNKISPQKIE